MSYGRTVSLRGDSPPLRVVPDPVPESCPDPICRIWLDDVRPAPEGWVWCTSVPEARALLAQGDVVCISLDHDLGDGEETGYDLLCWIENAMAARAWYGKLPEFLIHSANPTGRRRMAAALLSITRLHAGMIEENETPPTYRTDNGFYLGDQVQTPDGRRGYLDEIILQSVFYMVPYGGITTGSVVRLDDELWMDGVLTRVG